MKIEWVDKDSNGTFTADLSPFPLLLQVWPDGDDRTKYWASIDIPKINTYWPANDGPFSSPAEAMTAAETLLRGRLQRLIAVFDGFVSA